MGTAQQGLQRKEVSSKRAFQVTSSFALLPSHLVDFYERTRPDLDECEKAKVASLS